MTELSPISLLKAALPYVENAIAWPEGDLNASVFAMQIRQAIGVAESGAGKSDPTAADLLAAMKDAVHHIEKARLVPNGNLDTSTFLVMFMDRIAQAEGAGIRAQSFADRERELLVANNEYLERARAAERERAHLREHVSEMTQAFVGQFIRFGQRVRRHRDALRAIIPHAELHAENTAIYAAAAKESERPLAEAVTARIVANIDAAKKLLEV